MPFSGNHRTICAVLEDIRALGQLQDFPDLAFKIDALVTEAKSYAQRMSAKLMEYKEAEDLNSKTKNNK